MRPFLLKISIYMSVLLVIHLLALLSFPADHEPFYKRFTSGKQTMLIVGSSRAAQGLIPEVFNKKLENTAIYNYSFTKSTSPFGEVYLNSIKKKLEKPGSVSKPLFLIEVNPWTLSTEIVESKEFFSEESGILASVSLNNLNPNPLYFISTYGKGWGNMFLEKVDSTYVLHDDGWLEVNAPLDSIQRVRNTESKINDYRNDELIRSIKSPDRLNSLKKTISFFEQRNAEIYLIRLPIHEDLLKIEEDYFPDFDELLMSLTNSNTLYINLKDERENVIFNDGNHLNKVSSKIISERIAEIILEKRDLE